MSGRIIGILGGMGPEATLALFERIIRATPAARDQDHHRVVMDSNPGVPDRTAAIEGRGEDPLPVLAEMARNLERAGAGFIVIPCNTAHHWLAGMRAAVSIPIVDMIGETAARAAAHAPRLQTLGLMATSGTLATGLYQRALDSHRIGVITPDAAGQAVVMETIYRVKAGDYSWKPRIIEVAHGLLARGAEGVVLGCTEIPLVVAPSDLPCPVFDALEILARTSVALASRPA